MDLATQEKRRKETEDIVTKVLSQIPASAKDVDIKIDWRVIVPPFDDDYVLPVISVKFTR